MWRHAPWCGCPRRLGWSPAAPAAAPWSPLACRRSAVQEEFKRNAAAVHSSICAIITHSRSTQLQAGPRDALPHPPGWLRAAAPRAHQARMKNEMRFLAGRPSLPRSTPPAFNCFCLAARRRSLQQSAHAHAHVRGKRKRTQARASCFRQGTRKGGHAAGRSAHAGQRRRRLAD